MGKKPLTFSERLQKTVDKYNERGRKNMELFKSLGGDKDKPIDLMTLIKKEKK